MKRSFLGRVVALLIAAGCLVLVSAQPAAAHGGGGTTATNFVTALDGVTPNLPGVSIKLIEAGARLELRNDGPEVIVLGDSADPTCGSVPMAPSRTGRARPAIETVIHFTT